MTESRVHQPGGLLNPGWFQVASGEHAGEWHISAWLGTAILTLDPLPRAGGDGTKWIGLAVCPICAALILNDDVTADVFGRNVTAHEQHHARTDLPLPAEARADG